MITQRRRSAGIRITHGKTDIHLDPGPGALVHSIWASLNPQKLDAILVTHCHPDHYSDSEVLIEAMSRGTTKSRGLLAAPRSVLYGNEQYDPSISAYHRSLPSVVEVMKLGHPFSVGSMVFEPVEARHNDPDGVGLRMEVPLLGSLGYTSDTGFFPALGEIYGGLRVLILCVMWPMDQFLHYHLSTNEALEVIKSSNPGCAILTHFGMRMLNADPEAEASYIEEETGVSTVAARDGTRVIVEKNVEVRGPRKKDEPRVFKV